MPTIADAPHELEIPDGGGHYMLTEREVRWINAARNRWLAIDATDPPIWTGDLEDDCHLHWRNYFAHAECLNRNQWHCMVWKEVEGREIQVFHADESDILPKTGRASRWLCELVIAAASVGVFPTTKLST